MVVKVGRKCDRGSGNRWCWNYKAVGWALKAGLPNWVFGSKVWPNFPSLTLSSSSLCLASHELGPVVPSSASPTTSSSASCSNSSLYHYLFSLVIVLLLLTTCHKDPIIILTITKAYIYGI